MQEAVEENRHSFRFTDAVDYLLNKSVNGISITQWLKDCKTAFLLEKPIHACFSQIKCSQYFFKVCFYSIQNLKKS